MSDDPLKIPTEHDVTVSSANYAFCAIHGAFYSGYCECPVCERMRKDDDEQQAKDPA